MISELRDVSATLDNVEPKQTNEGEIKKNPKKAKWHLGIRSQSKPQDIMNEVFKAMRASNMVSLFLMINSEFIFHSQLFNTIAMEILQFKYLQS